MKLNFVLALVACSVLLNWPLHAIAADSKVEQPVRAVHFVMRGVGVGDVKRIVGLARNSGFNTLIISMADGIRLNSFPGRPLENALNADEFKDVVQFARQQGLDVIPEIKLLTHQEKFLGNTRPDLMFNARTYDPRKPEVHALVLAYLEELIVLLHPKAILIGHDEAVGWKERHFEKGLLKPGERILPADLFLEDVNRIHAYLKKRNVETWMWGDMLISPEEFPEMLAGGLHGESVGYGKALRDKLPRDIVICDWHYLDSQAEFPSLATFKTEGFRVLGATWKKPQTIRNFSRYAATHGADGMIATTWFHVQNKEWDVVERIIRESGQAFGKDFAGSP